MASTSTVSVPTTSIATAFIRKLYRMLDIEDPQVIGWDAAGQSFSICDEKQLDECVLPRYFRGRVDVFRQHLAEHGFRSTTRAVEGRPIETLHHEYFVRGAPSRLTLITRMPSTKRRRSKLGKKRAVASDSEGLRTSLLTPLQSVEEESCECPSPTCIDDDDFDLSKFLLEPTTLEAPLPVECQTSTGAESESLHDSLVRLLAFHVTNPVATSLSMNHMQHNGRQCIPLAPQVETPVFTDDMMASMVEWLDTSA